mgnify:CR=1 FL=1
MPQDYQKTCCKECSQRASKWNTKCRIKYKLKAIQLVGKGVLACKRCGCADLRVLEINHKNLNGRRELKLIGSGMTFYRKIITGIRKTDDLELLCKVCNNAHYCEKRYKLKWNISLGWRRNRWRISRLVKTSGFRMRFNPRSRNIT